MMNAKVRYAGMDQDLNNRNPGDSDSDQDLAELEEYHAELMMPFNPSTKVLNLNNKSCTDMKGNARVILPKPLEANLEADLANRKYKFMDIFAAFKGEFCNNKGDQKSNLSLSQKGDLINKNKNEK